MECTSASIASQLKTRHVVISVHDAPQDDQKSKRTNGKDRTDLLPQVEESEHRAVLPDTDITRSPCSLSATTILREPNLVHLQDPELSTYDSATERTKKKKEKTRIRPQSFDFGVPIDPPTKLIENFLEHQAATGNLCLDMDVRMIERIPAATIAKDVKYMLPAGDPTLVALYEPNVKENHSHFPVEYNIASHVQEGKKGGAGIPSSTVLAHAVNGEHKPAELNNIGDVKFCDGDASHSSSDGEGDSWHRITRSSRDHIQRSSRLADKPPSDAHSHTKSKQLKSGPARSGLLHKSRLLGRIDGEEDDPFKDEDIPESLKGSKLSLMLVVQWVAFFIIMGWLICSLTIPALIKRPLWSMALWKWALLVLLLFCGRLVSGWIVTVLVLILERNFLMRKRVVYFVYGLRKGFQNFLWFALAVLEWRLVFDPKVESATDTKVLPYVTKVLNCLLIAAIIWLVKIFFVKILASSFHVSTYFERIRESLFGQWVLETLSGPPMIQIEQEAKLIEEVNDLKKAGAEGPDVIMPKTNVQPGRSGKLTLGVSGLLGGKSTEAVGTGKSGFIRKGRLTRISSQLSTDKKSAMNTGITIHDLHRLNERNVSAWNMKKFMNFVRYRGIYTLAHVIDQTAAQSDYDGQEMEIRSEWQAVTVAKKIFKNVAKPGARYILRDDLRRFMLESEVERAFPLFEGSEETGNISKTALKNFAVHVVRERRVLSLALNDAKTAVNKLHRIVDVIVGIIILIVCLLVLGLTTTHLLVVVSSQLLLVGFIFGNTCKNVFEAIVFLFVMHPFDVGDRCVIDGTQLVVEEMNILSTLFARNNGERI
ncbi:hypothetical protein KP509_22G069800 [Ceratopteris richardii]|nr:hypothetical protein KP509_22G069800 [Ceratopteris richardii]